MAKIVNTITYAVSLMLRKLNHKIIDNSINADPVKMPISLPKVSVEPTPN